MVVKDAALQTGPTACMPLRVNPELLCREMLCQAAQHHYHGNWVLCSVVIRVGCTLQDTT